MKYSLSARQPREFQKKADELLVADNDYRYIPELFIEFPDKMIILDVPNDRFPEIQKDIASYAEANRKYFCCKIYDLRYVNWFKENNIKFFYGYPVSTFYEINGLKDLGTEYIVITAPITFKMNILKQYYKDIKFRMVPNVAYSAYIPRENGLVGQWVRPEDVKYYEKGIYIFDFEDAKELIKERTLYHIYAEQKKWPGNLNLLISNFNIDVDNRAMLDDLGETRSNCGQRCQETGRCRKCQTAIKFEKTIKQYKDYIENRELPVEEKELN